MTIHFIAKMGFIDDILGPIKEAISGVENVIEDVVKLFGEAVRFLENVIQTIKDVIEQIANLFNANKIEYMFIHPFKDAALTAIGDLDKLVSIALKAGGLGKDILGDIIDGVEDGVKDVVTGLKEGMLMFEHATSRLLRDIVEGIENIGYDVYAGFDAIFEDLKSFPSYLDDFGRKIEKLFEINAKKAYNTALEFDHTVERKVISTKHEITSTGDQVYESLDNFKNSIEARMKAESDSIDFLVILLLVLIVGAVIGVYMLTKSVNTVLLMLSMMVAIAIIVFVIELIA